MAEDREVVEREVVREDPGGRGSAGIIIGVLVALVVVVLAAVLIFGGGGGGSNGDSDGGPTDIEADIDVDATDLGDVVDGDDSGGEG